jgi:hypothetical protein
VGSFEALRKSSDLVVLFSVRGGGGVTARSLVNLVDTLGARCAERL